MEKLITGDSLVELCKMGDGVVDMVMCSPPYWGLRDYGVDGQLGLESTFEEYINKLCDIFDGVKRVLKKEGTCWVNMGDTYASNGGASRHFGYQDPKYKNGRAGNFVEPSVFKQSVKPKSLCMVPQRFAIEMVNRGWILRNVVVWHKPNAMPSSAKDRFTVDFEYVYFFVKSGKYYFNQQFEEYTAPLNRWGGNKFNYRVRDADKKKGACPQFKATKEEIEKYAKSQDALLRDRDMRPNGNGRNKRTVWKIPTQSFPEAHFAIYPPELVEHCMRAGCPEGGVVLDPFSGAGTTGVVAKQLGRDYIGIDLSSEYNKMAEKRIRETPKPLFII